MKKKLAQQAKLQRSRFRALRQANFFLLVHSIALLTQNNNWFLMNHCLLPWEKQNFPLQHLNFDSYLNHRRPKLTLWIYYEVETRGEYITKLKQVVNILRNRKNIRAYMGSAIYLSGIWDKNDSLCSHVVFIAAPVLLRLVLKRISRVWSFNVYYISICIFIFKAAHLLTVSFIRGSIN